MTGDSSVIDHMLSGVRLRARGQPSSRREDGLEGVMEPWWPARLEGLRARRVMRHDSNDWQNECMRLRNDRDSVFLKNRVKDSGVLYMLSLIHI